jgi:signal peptidase II
MLSTSPRATRIASLRALLVMVVVLVLDQLTKHLLESSLRQGSESRLLPGLALVNTRNHGIAFGVQPGGLAVMSVVIGLALLALLLYFLRHATSPLIWLPTGLIFGGAIGNIIDRAREGAVTDFIKLPLGWPPFNLADASITVGIVILILLVGREDSRRRKESPDVGAADAAVGRPDRGSV